MDAEKVDRVEKQLDHHLNNRKCESCTVKGKSYADCFDNLFTDALSVIRELKAENKRLMKENADAVKQIKNEIKIVDKEIAKEGRDSDLRLIRSAFVRALDIIN